MLSGLGYQRKSSNILCPFCDDMVSLVLAGGDNSTPFEISKIVKQGCVLASVLFDLFFTCVVNHFLDRGIYIKNRLNGSLTFVG